MPVSIGAELRLAYLRAAISAQTDEEEAIHRNRQFYDGEQGIELTDRQSEYLGDIANDLDSQAFANICARCVQIPLERMSVTNIAAGDDSAMQYAEWVSQWREHNRLDAMQSDLYEAALRDRAACLIVAWDAEAGMPAFTVNELYDGIDGQIRMHFNGDTGELMYASKRWNVWDPAKPDETGKARLTMYFDDRVERYEETRDNPTGWRMLQPGEIDGGLPNPQPWLDERGDPLGLPVIPFFNPGESELDDVLMPQKALNKSLADLLSSADHHGFPILTATGVEANIDTATGRELMPKFGPGRMLRADSPEARFGRIEPADLDRLFKSGVMSWIYIAALIKGWPAYLFDRSINPPSGEALKQMEAGLVAQVEAKQRVFGDAWRDALELGAKLHNLYRRGDAVQVGKLDVQWKPAATRDEKIDIEAKAIKWEKAQIPVEMRWREAGYTPEQIDEMNRMMSGEIAQTVSASVAAAIRKQQAPDNNGSGEFDGSDEADA